MQKRYIHRPLMALALALAATGVALAQSSATNSGGMPALKVPNTPPNADGAKTGQQVSPGESSQTTGTSRRDSGSTSGTTSGSSDYNNMPATNAGPNDTSTGTSGTGTTGVDNSSVTPDKGPHTKTKKKRHHKRSTTSSQSDPYENADPSASGRPANPEMGTTSPPLPAASKSMP